ncbi:hypothetical protein SLEP1_g4712 [Rubroshorea leprosula]|uniref:Reverse transcriptase n=1 Tax=Rubroshorea leprosula TaxID=152421 RepID=A0AAV5HTW9_9ROSI|nr:hypothetical protein SLEP1_g4712 [Rubroshorea leprosula]
MDWAAKPSVRQSGGLISMWNSDIFKKYRIFEGNGFLGVSEFWGLEGTPVKIVNVYAPCELQGQRKLWGELKNLIQGLGGNWCVMGDFNAVRSNQEFTGNKRHQGEMREFDEFIAETELQDLPLIEEKMDWGPKPFKVFDSWFDYPEFKESVAATWNSSIVQGKKGFVLKEKLKKLKAFLKNWSKNLMPEVENKTNTAKENIEKIDKARKEWIKDGDANTRFFHKCIKGRWRRNEINSIMINGKNVQGVKEVKEEVAAYFEKMFQEEAWD